MEMFAVEAEHAAALAIVGLVMVACGFIGIPSSELALTVAGAYGAREELGFVPLALISTLGNLVGTSLLFLLTRRYGPSGLETMRHRWRVRAGLRRRVAAQLPTPAELALLGRWLRPHAWLWLSLGRCLPTVRILVAIPAALLGVSLKGFLVWSTPGILVWTVAWQWLGYSIGATALDGHPYRSLLLLGIGGFTAWGLHRVSRRAVAAARRSSAAA